MQILFKLVRYLLKLCLSLLLIRTATCEERFVKFYRWDDLADKTCPTSERVIGKNAISAIQCAALCRNNAICTSMTYSTSLEVCHGCKKRLEAQPESLVTVVPSTMFYSKGLEPPVTCADILSTKPNATSGVYRNKLGIDLYCDMETDGGGWTVFQRRFDKSLYFFREWDDFKNGFGTISSEFWFGLEKLTNILHIGNRKFGLRIDLEDKSGSTFFAVYQTFDLAGESDNYRLLIGNYSGSAGDDLLSNNGTVFTTSDADNDEKDGNCAYEYQGGWWYRDCYRGLNNDHPSYAMIWYTLGNSSLDKSSMKIREY